MNDDSFHVPNEYDDRNDEPLFSSRNKNLRLVNVNAQSIVNKTDLLEITLLQHDPHVTVITETWLRNEISDDTIFPPNYKVFRKDRASRGGGVAVLIKQQIEAILLDDIADLECLCIKLSCWGQHFILYALYRPPDTPPEYLSKLEQHISQYHKHKIILVGDFNLPTINWELMHAGHQNVEHANIMFSVMFTHDLAQLVHDPTRVQGSCSSVLDLIFFNRSDIFQYSLNIPCLSNPDYLITILWAFPLSCG